MMCFVIVTVFFCRKESLENKKSEKAEGDQKKPKDSKVFILKSCLFKGAAREYFSRPLCILAREALRPWRT